MGPPEGHECAAGHHCPAIGRDAAGDASGLGPQERASPRGFRRSSRVEPGCVCTNRRGQLTRPRAIGVAARERASFRCDRRMGAARCPRLDSPRALSRRPVRRRPWRRNERRPRSPSSGRALPRSASRPSARTPRSTASAMATGILAPGIVVGHHGDIGTARPQPRPASARAWSGRDPLHIRTRTKCVRSPPRRGRRRARAPVRPACGA